MDENENIKLKNLIKTYYILPKTIRKKIWQMAWSKYETPITINTLLYVFSIVMGVYVTPYDITIPFCLFFGTLFIYNLICKAINFELYSSSVKYIKFIENTKNRGVKENREKTNLYNIVVYKENQNKAER